MGRDSYAQNMHLGSILGADVGLSFFYRLLSTNDRQDKAFEGRWWQAPQMQVRDIEERHGSVQIVSRVSNISYLVPI